MKRAPDALPRPAFAPRIRAQLRHDVPYAWHLRHQASLSPLFRLDDLLALDERLEAGLAAFGLAETAGDSLLAMLDPDDWGAVFVAMVTALRQDDTDAPGAIAERIDSAARQQECFDALVWDADPRREGVLGRLLRHDNPYLRAAALQAASHLRAEINPRYLHERLRDDHPAVVTATLRVIADGRLPGFETEVQNALSSSDADSRFAAARAALLLGLPPGVSALQAFAFEDNPHLRDALMLLHQSAPDEQIPIAVQRIQRSPLSPRIKAYNLGMAGLPEHIPLLIEWMQDPEYAPLAAEAFTFITGVDFDLQDLDQIAPEICEDPEHPLNRKRRQDPWATAYEQDLPWPDPERVQAWWQAHAAGFMAGTRYLGGLPYTRDNMRIILRQGSQPQRRVAALYLAIRGGQVLFPVRANARWQTTWLGAETLPAGPRPTPAGS